MPMLLTMFAKLLLKINQKSTLQRLLLVRVSKTKIDHFEILSLDKNPPPSNRYYFYQANDIYHTYLSGFNTRMLIHEYGSHQNCPDELNVRIEAIESFFMTEVC